METPINPQPPADTGVPPPASGSAPSDTDRLNFLLRYFSVADNGDEEFCPAVVVEWDALEDALFEGFCDGVERDAATCLKEDVRTVIDRAMARVPNT
jgi:hypothetical protein